MNLKDFARDWALRSPLYQSIPADQYLELPSDELRPCPDCGQMFTAYKWRMHRGPSYNENCPNNMKETSNGC